MNKGRVLATTQWRSAALLLLIAAASVTALARAGSMLESELPGGLPIGNALAATALVTAAGAAVLLAASGSWLHALAWLALAAALAWLPASIALAGNAALVFGNGRGDAWVTLSLATLALTAVSLLLSLATAIWRRLKRARPAEAGPAKR